MDGEGSVEPSNRPKIYRGDSKRTKERIAARVKADAAFSQSLFDLFGIEKPLCISSKNKKQSTSSSLSSNNSIIPDWVGYYTLFSEWMVEGGSTESFMMMPLFIFENE